MVNKLAKYYLWLIYSVHLLLLQLDTTDEESPLILYGFIDQNIRLFFALSNQVDFARTPYISIKV